MTSAGARMSAEQRRRSAPKSDAAATSAIGDGAAVRGGGEASPAGHVVRGAGHWLMGWAELGFWAGTSLGLCTSSFLHGICFASFLIVNLGKSHCNA